jgi:hypothetical protein
MEPYSTVVALFGVIIWFVICRRLSEWQMGGTKGILALGTVDSRCKRRCLAVGGWVHDGM